MKRKNETAIPTLREEDLRAVSGGRMKIPGRQLPLTVLYDDGITLVTKYDFLRMPPVL